MHVEAFESMEAAFASMNADEERANAGLFPPQVALRDDVEHTRHFAVAYEDCLGIGEVPSHDSLVARTTASMDPDNPEDVEEAEWEVAQLPELRARGYLTGTVHTVYGDEWRDTHASQVIPITEKAFAEARRAGWKAVALDRLMTLMLDPDQVADLVHQGKITPTLVEEIDTFRRAFGED